MLNLILYKEQVIPTTWTSRLNRYFFRLIAPSAWCEGHRVQLRGAGPAGRRREPARRSRLSHLPVRQQVHQVLCVAYAVQPLQADGLLLQSWPSAGPERRFLRVQGRGWLRGVGWGLGRYQGLGARVRIPAHIHGLHGLWGREGSGAVAQILWCRGSGVPPEPYEELSTLQGLGEWPKQGRLLFKPVCDGCFIKS